MNIYEPMLKEPRDIPGYAEDVLKAFKVKKGKIMTNENNEMVTKNVVTIPSTQEHPEAGQDIPDFLKRDGGEGEATPEKAPWE